MKKRAVGFFLVLSLWTVFRFFVVDHGHTKALLDFDEARYAEVAKQIVHTGSWFVQHAGGPDDVSGLYLWKPPLHPVLIALSYQLFGINEFAVRFPTLLFFLGNCLLLFLLAKQLFPKEKYVPYLASLLFAFFPDNAFLYQQGIAEQQLLFCNLAALLCVLYSHKTRSLICAGVLWGLAILTKGFASWWTPFVILLFPLSSPKLHLRHWMLFVGSALAVALPWHLYMLFVFKDVFIQNYMLANTLGRSVGAVPNSAPVWWYGAWMLWSWRPALFFTISGISFPWKRQSVFLLLWFLVIIIPFSLISSKVWWYILPASVPLLLFSSYLLVHIPLPVFVLSLISILPVWNMGALSIPLQGVLCIFVFALAVILRKRFVLKASPTEQNLLRIGVLCICVFLSLAASKNVRDKNAALKLLLKRNTISRDFSVYRMPYEAALFYANTHSVHRDDVSARYIVTPLSQINSVGHNFWLIDREGEFALMKKIY